MNINDLKKDRNFYIKQELKKYLSEDVSKLVLSCNEDEVENVVYLYSHISKDTIREVVNYIVDDYDIAENLFMEDVKRWLKYECFRERPCDECSICSKKEHNCDRCNSEEYIGMCDYSFEYEDIFCCDECYQIWSNNAIGIDNEVRHFSDEGIELSIHKFIANGDNYIIF